MDCLVQSMSENFFVDINFEIPPNMKVQIDNDIENGPFILDPLFIISDHELADIGAASYQDLIKHGDSAEDSLMDIPPYKDANLHDRNPAQNPYP